jgi:hypothetical protein
LFNIGNVTKVDIVSVHFPIGDKNKVLCVLRVSVVQINKKTPPSGSFESRKAALYTVSGGIPIYISVMVMASWSHTSTQLSQPRHSSALTGTDFPSSIS